MKKEKLLILIAFLLLSYLSQAQLIMIDGETGEYKYEEVVMVDGISQQEIRARAKKWLELYYSSIDSVKVVDTSLNTPATIEFTWKLVQKSIPIQIFFDIEIKTKDNKYKYSFSNFREGKVTRGEIDAKSLKVYVDRFPARYQIYIEEPVDTKMTKAINSLEYYVQNGTLDNLEEDW